MDEDLQHFVKEHRRIMKEIKKLGKEYKRRKGPEYIWHAEFIRKRGELFGVLAALVKPSTRH